MLGWQRGVGHAPSTYTPIQSNMLIHESFGSCSGAVLLAEGGVDVLSGQETDRLETTLGDVRGRAAAALARRQEAQEQAASHRQKRDKVVQASNLLKVGRAVRRALHWVHGTLQTTGGEMPAVLLCCAVQKRNQAQLLRVKRQLQEFHAHKRRWEEEASHLQATIDELKGNMEQGTRN